MVAFAAMVGLITGLTIGDLQHENTNVVKENIVQKKVEKKFQHNGYAFIVDKKKDMILVLSENSIKKLNKNDIKNWKNNKELKRIR